MTERTADRVAELLGAEGPLAERYAIVGTLEGTATLARWRAEDRETGKPVVIFASTATVDAALRASVEQRLEMLRDAPHPNVAEIVDFGEFEGLMWVVENLVAHGETLQEVVERRGRLTLQELVPIVAQLLKAYGHTHLRELAVGPIAFDQIHLVERSNRFNFVRIERFGWTNPLRAGADAAGRTVLTAPEDLDGAHPTVESDVFVVGRLIFELLGGARLDMQRLGPDGDGQPCSAEGDMLVELVPESEGVPPELHQLVHATLAVDPSDRPADGNAIVEGLIDFLPVHMFRLPSKTGVKSSRRSSESSLTGQSMVLTGSWLEAAERQLAREERAMHESGEDLSASGSRAVATLSSSQSMRSERPGEAPPGPRAQPKKGGVPGWMLGAATVGLLGAGALAAFMVANPGSLEAKGPNGAERASAAVDQVEPVAASPRPTETKSTRSGGVSSPGAGPAGAASDDAHDGAAADEDAPDAANAEAGDEAGGDAADTSDSSPRRTKKTKRAKPSAATTDDPPSPDEASAEAPTEAPPDPPPTTKKTKKKNDGLLGPGAATSSSKQPSSKASDAFLPPTG